MIKLCHINDIPEGSAQEFNLADGRRIFIVQKDGSFHGYRNNCPHANWPLNMTPNGFLDIEKRYIRCVNHMALFEIASGKCISGPCPGASLEKEGIILDREMLWIEAPEMEL